MAPARATRVGAVAARHAPLEASERAEAAAAAEAAPDERPKGHAEQISSATSTTVEWQQGCADASATESESVQEVEVTVAGDQTVRVDEALLECIRGIRVQSGKSLSSKKVFQKLQRMGWGSKLKPINRKVVAALWESPQLLE